MSTRIGAAIELACFVAFVHLMIWIVEPHASASIRLTSYVVVLSYAVATAWAHHDSHRELGLRLDNFGRSARAVFPVTFALGLALAACGLALGSLRIDARGADRAAVYFVWALLQQYALQAIVHRRLVNAGVTARVAPFVAAMIFSTAHIPNVPLMAFTFTAGWLWALWFRRNPNLFTLAISHAALALVLVSALPPDWMQNLRVGPGYRQHLDRHR